MDTPPQSDADKPTPVNPSIPPHLFPSSPPSLPDFQKLCSQILPTGFYPFSNTVQLNIPIYDLSSHSPHNHEITTSLQREWHHILLSGPGVFVLRNMFSPSVIARCNAVIQKVIEHEKSITFPGQKEKYSSNNKAWVWNIFSKHCLQDPEMFYDYYSNPWLALVSAMWLGPKYQITAQVNNVGPGGEAQKPHRDYHLGFLSPEILAQVPVVTQLASQLMTLQGAVAHSDMPTGSGSTRFLPFSQLFREGFSAFKRDDFQSYFAANWKSLELQVGDSVFFNPGIYHAAGANQRSDDFVRKAVLLQISSMMGKPMELVKSGPLIERCWEVLKERYEATNGQEERWAEVRAFVAAVGKGYKFPADLDQISADPVAALDEQQLMMKALEEGWEKESLLGELKARE